MNDMRLSEQELSTIEQMAGCNYGPDDIALFLQVDKKAFNKCWNDKDSEIREAYDRGVLIAKYDVHLKQKENAQSGNITAAQIFLKESKALTNQQILKRVLYED